MRKDREENNSTELTGRMRPKGADFAKLAKWVLGGAVVGLLFYELKKLEKLLMMVVGHTPPIIIKSGSFIIGVSKQVGDLEENDNNTEDNDLLDPDHDYFRYKQERRSIKCVVLYENGRPTRCEKFNSPGVPEGRCIIKFYFGGSPNTHPDILVKGNNFRIRSKHELRRITGDDLLYYYRSTSGNNLCAVIYRRHLGVLTQLGDEIILPNDDSTRLEIESDRSQCPDIC